MSRIILVIFLALLLTGCGSLQVDNAPTAGTSLKWRNPAECCPDKEAPKK